MNISVIGLLALLVSSSGFFINDAFAEVNENSAYLLEGSGFAVTEEFIRLSEIDIGLSSHQQVGSSIDFLIEDGFITLDNEDFIISELEGKFLREGRYIRINGNIESMGGFDTTISFFGRLVEESKDAAIYGFTGRITTLDNSYKIIYTSKLSQLTKVIDTTEISIEDEMLTIHILPGSSGQGVADSYIESGETRDPRLGDVNPLRLSYFSEDRITVEPGTTISFVNDDNVSHSIISGKENYNDRHDPFTPDGRISTVEIFPGESINITFDEVGFYRLFDPTYPWMKIVAYSFPDVDRLILGSTKNQQRN
ncbi:MAG TPA: plastocyanin/azurin family copper-binding protein [Nitrosopumilaceae archaeon]|nr:plastocyanin/azurin family copper-binding protein [Nitrosopumilaceae archaeon]